MSGCSRSDLSSPEPQPSSSQGRKWSLRAAKWFSPWIQPSAASLHTRIPACGPQSLPPHQPTSSLMPGRAGSWVTMYSEEKTTGAQGRTASPASSHHPRPLLLLLVIIFNSQPFGHRHLQSGVSWSVRVRGRLEGGTGGFWQKAFSPELLDRRVPRPEAEIFQQKPVVRRLWLPCRILTPP